MSLKNCMETLRSIMPRRIAERILKPIKLNMKSLKKNALSNLSCINLWGRSRLENMPINPQLIFPWVLLREEWMGIARRIWMPRSERVILSGRLWILSHKIKRIIRSRSLFQVTCSDNLKVMKMRTTTTQLILKIEKTLFHQSLSTDRTKLFLPI